MHPATRFIRTLSASLLLLTAGARVASAADGSGRLAELDAFWREVSRAVRDGDFDGYCATFHEDGVLVNGSKGYSIPLAQAAAKWRQGFMDTKAGRMKAEVRFRFSRRLGDENTAHETGIFLYSTTDASGQTKDAYVHFEELLVKKGAWRTLMEFQKGPATKGEWDALGTSSSSGNTG